MAHGRTSSYLLPAACRSAKASPRIEGCRSKIPTCGTDGRASKRFNGFKQHVSTHVDADLVLACTVMPANRPEDEAAPLLQADMARMGLMPVELLIDRAYVNSTLV